MAEEKWIEKRVCKRFEIPGTTLNYSLKKTSDPKQKDTESWEEEFCPVLDVSCGGIKYSGKKLLAINSDITIKIFIPGERAPLILYGEVRWLSTQENREICIDLIKDNPKHLEKYIKKPSQLTLDQFNGNIEEFTFAPKHK